ncbi:hypothetical protein [Streptomyces nodosus]|uniref:Uncharacterized protein n=1 Tax=Streptomyces nodosus TaxID=40318 RepID=A0A0B5DHU9_9ACTN|nr:hypothetical protein [Streptomyces nodosus]AJE40735.1 hypothetical protein SNOD_12205 [Streptomyces nodosus]MBB4791796.1 hypothetical protein [Streptomyces nodosus]QEV39284.1 hypothetical protein CP978_12535 [Streptomyces nodosus]
MTVLHLADDGEAADLAAFLSRLIHYDRGAAVRLQAARTALAVFGRPPSFEVLAVRAVRLAKPYENGIEDRLDVTVSAGELLESVDESAATATVPAAVTGPPWAGVLPPRGGWRPEPGLPARDALRAAVAAGVTEFRARTEELPPERRIRTELDRIGREIWSRTVGNTGLPVRAVHAAQSLGFLRPTPQEPGIEPLGLFSSGRWLRLRTPFGSVAVRGADPGLGALGVSVR